MNEKKHFQTPGEDHTKEERASMAKSNCWEQVTVSQRNRARLKHLGFFYVWPVSSTFSFLGFEK